MNDQEKITRLKAIIKSLKAIVYDLLGYANMDDGYREMIADLFDEAEEL